MKVTKPKKLRRSLRLPLAVCLCAVTVCAVAAKAHKPTPLPPQVTESDRGYSLWIAAKPVARGQRLSEVSLQRVPWPKDALTGRYLDSSELTPRELSLSALTPIAPNTPIPLQALTDSAVLANPVAESIPEGLRVITIGVDAESGVEGWVRPGSAVDIILRERREGRLFANVVAANVKVLSADRTTAPADGRPRQTPATVSVLVSQEDALKIILAKELGELSLSLRGPADNAPTIARSIDDKKILGTPTEQTPIGVAKGPDGQLYSLANNHSRPVRVESTPIME